MAINALQAFTAIIPARLASTRLPGKVLADIHGKPMVVRVAERVLHAGFAHVAIATDAPEVADVVHAHGYRAILTDDCPTGTDRVAQAAQKLGLNENDFVINVQGDEPLIDTALLIKTAQALISSAHGCATPIGAITEWADAMNPNVVKCVINARSEALYFSRAPIPYWRDGFPHAQTLPKHYRAYRHYGVYAFRAPLLKQFSTLPHSDLERIESLEQLRLLQAGHTVLAVEVCTAPTPAVDTAEDLAKVRTLWPSLNPH